MTSPILNYVYLYLEVKGNSLPTIVDMPLEVLEEIIPYISGLDAMHLSQASKLLGSRVFEAVKVKNVIHYETYEKCNFIPRLAIIIYLQRWKFWKSACFQNLPCEHFYRVLSSYNNVLNRTVRTEYFCAQNLDPKMGMMDALTLFDWEHVFFSAFKVKDNLKSFNVRVEEWNKFEGKLKDEMILTYARPELRGYELRSDSPRRITSTCGSIIYNVLSPYKPNSYNDDNVVSQYALAKKVII